MVKFDEAVENIRRLQVNRNKVCREVAEHGWQNQTVDPGELVHQDNRGDGRAKHPGKPSRHPEDNAAVNRKLAPANECVPDTFFC